MAPIHDAARSGDDETLRRLLAEGVSPDAIDDEPLLSGRTPLHGVCRIKHVTSDHVACIKLLCDAGANLEAVDHHNGGNTPLHSAANTPNANIVSLLVKAGANVHAVNYTGWTALHFAAWRTVDGVEVLLAAGADINVRSISYRSPFDIALESSLTSRRAWPLFLRAGAELPAEHPDHPWSQDPYILRVRNAGGFNKYAQAHLARVTSILAPTPLLPPELVRHVVSFWLHAGYY